VAELRHPNLLRMMPMPGGAGFSPAVEGATKLHDFMLPRGTFRRFELERVVRLLLDVLSGLEALHRLRLEDGAAFVHGEVSPQTIYLDEQGAARLVPLLGAHVIPSWRPVATGYVAPERLLGDTLDVRADIFSIGVLLWEALSGKQLFPDASADEALARLLGGNIPLAKVPPESAWAQPLCAIAARAISVSPAARYAGAAELRLAMMEAVGAKLTAFAADWPDEAPTPVLQPRLHLPKLRASTPPPSVLSLSPTPASSLTPVASPVQLTPQLVAAPPPAAISSEPAPPRPRRALAWLATFGVAASLALGLAALQPPNSSRGLAALLHAPGSYLSSLSAEQEPVRGVAAAAARLPAPALQGTEALQPLPSLPLTTPSATTPSVTAPAPPAAASATASAVPAKRPSKERAPKPALSAPRVIAPLAIPAKGHLSADPTSKSEVDRYGI